MVLIYPLLAPSFLSQGQHSVWLLNPASVEDNNYILQEQRVWEPPSAVPTPYQTPGASGTAPHRFNLRANILTPGNSPKFGPSGIMAVNAGASSRQSPSNLASIARSTSFSGQAAHHFSQRTSGGAGAGATPNQAFSHGRLTRNNASLLQQQQQQHRYVPRVRVRNSGSHVTFSS